MAGKIGVKGALLLDVLSILVLIIASSVGCTGNRSAKSLLRNNFDEVAVSYDGLVCLRHGNMFTIVKPDREGGITLVDTFSVPIPADARLLDFNGVGKRLFIASGDSVVAYDLNTGLFTTLTRGKFSEDVECARSSSDGQFLGFAASRWSIGKIVFWRLVVVDAVQGGIVHYCDSLPTPYSFQWVKPRRIGYAEVKYVRGVFDTVGVFYDTERNVKFSSRDATLDFLKNPCNPLTSPDGNWAAEYINGRLKIRWTGKGTPPTGAQ